MLEICRFDLADPDRGEQCRDAEGSDEGGARDLQAAHPQPQASYIDHLFVHLNLSSTLYHNFAK